MKKTLILPVLLSALSLQAFADGGVGDLWRDRSTRGFDFTIKGFIAPWGSYYETLRPSRHDARIGGGGALVASYRINKCLSFGVSWDFIASNVAHGGYVFPTGGNVKFNYLEREKFSPYVSLTMGYDWWGVFVDSVDDSGWKYGPNYDRYPGSGRPPLPESFYVSPSLGLDFPLKRCVLSAELRVDWVPDDSAMASLGFGVTF